ncbi:unnamed protein product [Calypogeia fissa]
MLSDSEAWFQDLLPGIPNEVTLNRINHKAGVERFLYPIVSISCLVPCNS